MWVEVSWEWMSSWIAGCSWQVGMPQKTPCLMRVDGNVTGKSMFSFKLGILKMSDIIPFIWLLIVCLWICMFEQVHHNMNVEVKRVVSSLPLLWISGFKWTFSCLMQTPLPNGTSLQIVDVQFHQCPLFNRLSFFFCCIILPCQNLDIHSSTGLSPSSLFCSIGLSLFMLLSVYLCH